ncbi:ribonuclease domain-containing protein [Kaistella sp. PBT33-4]|uniref:ribonuclease domain-containing protein n=1 Tax=Kaistella sp. PBT33-4 TaxID=3032000 RepID=UPI0023D83A25|nr:ribonuclease domain-containing protein [Kaistella sp. PBT33-4]MDF0720707.1 ribonuclease domain-containing protein [Kaistella sp. PBT33-4]
MRKDHIKLFLIFIIGLLSAYLILYYLNEDKVESDKSASVSQTEIQSGQNPARENVDALTEAGRVTSYVKTNKELPHFYLTKSEARALGWIPSEGNLCKVLPGKAIGGDKFGNREKQLPQGKQYFEADVNYSCGNRNGHRIIYTKEGEVWLTTDHYKTFKKQ